MGGEGRAAPRLRWQWVKKDGCAQRTGAHARPKPTSLSYIYLGSSVCLSSCHIPVVLSSCHPVIFAERWAILYVLVIKLTKETRRRVWRWRDYRWRDRKETDRRGRVWIYFSLFKPDFFPNWDFPGVFSKYHYFVVRVSEAAMCGEHYIFLGCRIAHLGWGIAHLGWGIAQ